MRTNYNESIQTRMKTLLGEGRERDWESATDEAQKILRDARKQLLAVQKKMRDTAPDQDLLNKFGPLVDNVLGSVQDAIAGFSY
jgi:vacuolar-type H+-ATPase subunit H